jgi:uncharacterized protein (TIGR02270 family)
MPKVIAEVVDQHAEESAFLWLLRDAAISAPHYLLTDLSRLDGRIAAHLDGLRAAGEPGTEIVNRALVEIGQSGETFVAAVLALEANDGDRVQEVLKVATAAPEVARGLISALGWLSFDKASSHIKSLLAAESPIHRRVGIAASAIHRKNPGFDIIQAAFASDDPLLKARALRAVGELGLADLHIPVRANIKAKDPACRFWAAWSSVLLNGNTEAVACLQSIADAGERFSEPAAAMAMRRLPTNDAKIWLKRLVKEVRQMRIAVVAAGALADPEVVPFLIEQMKVPALARVAGESFSLITGAHIAYDKLERPKPDGFEAGPTEKPEDENVSMDPDDNLAWPEPGLVQTWWNRRQGQFSKGTRYLLGQPITPESLRNALKNGYQRQRAAAALEQALSKPGRPLFEVRAPGARQQKLLA